MVKSGRFAKSLPTNEKWPHNIKRTNYLELTEKCRNVERTNAGERLQYYLIKISSVEKKKVELHGICNRVISFCLLADESLA